MASMDRLDRSDSDLARFAAAGSSEAYSELVRRHSAKLLNLARRMTGSRERAWDAVQDTWLAAWRGIESFRGDAQFYSWVRRILVNGILEQFRKNHLDMVSLDEPLGFEDTDEARDVPDDSFDPQKEVYRKETIGEIRGAVAGLPEIYKIVFLMREAEGMSYSEIAADLGIPEGTVRSRLNMARRILRESLTHSFNRESEVSAVRSGNEPRRREQ